jgi:ribosome-interacting GTPase 1
MPTNLPPPYFEVERQFREAETVEEKVALLEEMISIVPKHKGTDHLRADLKRKLSKLKSAAQARKGTGRYQSPYQIRKEGAGQAILVGPTNVGKSALLAKLTNASPEVSEAPYTTWGPTPGMMPVENTQVQLVDTPPLSDDYIDPIMMDLIRRTDLLLLLVDLQTYPVQQLKESVAILEEYRIIPHHLKDRFPEQGRLSFVPTIVIANKCDDENCDEIFEIFSTLLEEPWPMMTLSVKNGRNLDQFKQVVFERMDKIRVYSKPPGNEADLSAPFLLKKGSTVEVFASKVHQDFVRNLKSARVWGSGDFDGQMVGRDHILQDGDVVELKT